MKMVIYNAFIRTMADRVIEKGFIRVENGKIAEIGDMSALLDVPAENDINADGLTLYPGFIDAHCHLGMWGDGLGFEGEDGNEDTDPSTPHLRAIDSINPMDRGFSEAVAAGITTAITGVGSSNPIGGTFVAIKTAGSKRIDKLIVKSPVAIKFALGENPKKTFDTKDQTPVTRMATAAIIREQLAKAARYNEDMGHYTVSVGTENELDPPEYDIKCEALIPVLNNKVKAHFHCHRADDIFTAIRIAKEFSLDYVLIHCTEGGLIADELAAEDGGIILGPLFGDRSKPELVNHSIKTPAVLDRENIKFAICTDHPETPIQYLPLTAALAVKGGLSREKALLAITRNAAEIIGIEDRVGTLEIGKDADIVGFSGDPLDLQNEPRLVICSGKIIIRQG